MTRLVETLETRLPIEDTFAFVADFANSAAWDPGVASSQRLDDGPVAVGSRYKLGINMRGKVVPMIYEVTAWEPTRRVVLAGEGSGVKAVDEIVFTPTATGTRIDYTADIRLQGWMRLAQPFAGGALAKIADDAVRGMKQTLEERASAAATQAAASPDDATPAAASAEDATPAAASAEDAR
jgi:dehydrogenase/reductase SDR family member 12